MNPTSKIHVMHVVRHGLASGGMENGIINVTNGLPPLKYRVSICALDTQQTFSSRICLPDSEYHLLPKTGAGIDWRLVRKLARLFRSTKVDLVHSHNWGVFLYATLAAKLARVPIVHGEHGKNAAELDEINRAKLWAKRVLGSRVAQVITVSRAIADEWVGYGVPRKKIQWIPNGVDTERFHPREDQAQPRLAFGLPADGFILGTVGRFDPIKDYGLLITAHAHLCQTIPNCHLAFVGDGPCEADLRNQAIALGTNDRVHWLGRRRDPEGFLPALDAFVLPSKSEGMSNVVLEAMACGVAVVCADLPGHREVFIPDREGVVVSPCNPETLASALKNLFDSPDRRKQLGLAARAKTLDRFNLSRMVADYEHIYANYSRHATA